MNEEDEVRGLLLAVEALPSRVDLAHAIADARRHQRRRRIGRSVGACTLAVATLVGGVIALGHAQASPGRRGVAATHPVATPSTAPTSATESCTVEALAGFSGSLVRVVDPSGRFVVADQEVATNDGFYSLLWSDGKEHTVPLPPGATSLETNGINVHGTMVGMATTSAWRPFAFMYRDGKTTRLPALPGYQFSAANGINAAGDVVGVAFNNAGGNVPVIWPAAAPGAVHRLGSIKGDAFAIADDGTIVGTKGDGDAPWIWNTPGDAGHAMATPPGSPRGKVFAIHGEWAAGYVSTGAGGSVPATRWNLRTGAVQTFPDLMQGPANGVNARGDLVNSFDDSGDNIVIRDNGSLNLAVGPYRDWAAVAAWISDDGKTLIGTVSDPTTPASGKAVVWHC